MERGNVNKLGNKLRIYKLFGNTYKNLIFLLKVNFLYILNCFGMLILKNKKNIILIYFNIKYSNNY